LHPDCHQRRSNIPLHDCDISTYDSAVDVVGLLEAVRYHLFPGRHYRIISVVPPLHLYIVEETRCIVACCKIWALFPAVLMAVPEGVSLYNPETQSRKEPLDELLRDVSFLCRILGPCAASIQPSGHK